MVFFGQQRRGCVSWQEFKETCSSKEIWEPGLKLFVGDSPPVLGPRQAAHPLLSEA